MRLADLLLPEFDREMANTRTVLERVPEGKPDWRPHEKSMTLGRLAGHVSELAGWAAATLERGELDVAPPGQAGYTGYAMSSREEMLRRFDDGTKRSRAAIAGATDEQLGQPWTLKKGGETLFTLPRMAVLRSMVMNHLIHHRAMLAVYLRLNDVPVPALYGPSADDPRF